MAQKEMRAVYVDTLIELARDDPRIMVLDADLMKANGTLAFKNVYPERAINVGVAEANMVSIAAGLAAEGTAALCGNIRSLHRGGHSINFHFMRLCEASGEAGGSDPGISAAYNGGTHMPFEDIGIMKMVPELTIVEPSDPVSLQALVKALAASPKPGYLRLHRKAIEPIYGVNEKFGLGKAKLLRDGRDLVIVALGAIMVPEALRAADLLAKEGLSAAVIDALSAKPIDAELILSWAEKTGAVVTAENHQISGGLGSAVAELLAENAGHRNVPGPAVRFTRVGIMDQFGEVGTQDWLQRHFGLTAENIAAKARNLVSDHHADERKSI